jgi:hypothetical protein
MASTAFWRRPHRSRRGAGTCPDRPSQPANVTPLSVSATLAAVHPTGRAVVADGWLYLTDGQTLRAFNGRTPRTRADHRI